MTKEDKIELVQRRIRLLSVWKEISQRRKAFEPMMKIFHLLEADYDKCLVPMDDKEQIYHFFKTPNSFDRIVSTKLGKYLVKNYKEMVPADHVLSDFVANLNTIIWKQPPQFVVYNGMDIPTAYERCNHSKGVSTCMTRDGRHYNQLFLAINPNKVEMLCLEDAEKIHARVLVWTTDDGKRIVDRIYPNNGDLFHKILEHFKGMDNHYIREKHGPPNGNSPIPIEGLDRAFVTMNCKGLENFPYLDTMRYGKRTDDEILLTNSICTDPLTDIVFGSQYGYYTEIDD